MRVFGLTGGIASGKSTVARRLRELGVPVVDADQVARDVVAPGTPGLDEVVEAFGREVLDAGGALDRKRLGAIVFADPAARKRLEAITHPRIAAATQARLAELAAAGHALACYEAPLLVENGMHVAFRPLVVVSLTPAQQAERAAARDGSTLDEARARIAAQLPLEAKVKVADHVIDNGGTLAQTLAQTDAVLAAIRALP